LRDRKLAGNHLRGVGNIGGRGGYHFSDVVNMLEITGETEACWRLLERRRKHAGDNSREVGIDWRVTLTHIVNKFVASLWTGDVSCGPVGGSCEIMFDYSMKRFVYGMIYVCKLKEVWVRM
jgi:hypothetical protein